MITKYFQNVLWKRMDQTVSEIVTLAAILDVLEYYVTQVNLMDTLIGFNCRGFFSG